MFLRHSTYSVLHMGRVKLLIVQIYASKLDWQDIDPIILQNYYGANVELFNAENHLAVVEIAVGVDTLGHLDVEGPLRGPIERMLLN